MGEADIKAVLKGSSSSQISLDETSSVPNHLALADVLDFISLNSQRHAKTSMKTIMDRFTKAPYGFIEYDVQWIVAKLFKDGDIAFYVNNDIVSLITKSEDDIYKYITRKEYIEKLLTEKREKANDKQKKIVREVMKELFNAMPPSDEDDTMLASFHQFAGKLKSELEKLEIHYTSSPLHKYPGQTIVKEGKNQLINILSIKATPEFFKTIEKSQDDLLDMAEDYEPVKAFFGSEQKTIWDKTIDKLKIYQESKTFIAKKEIEEIVADIQTIIDKPPLS